ncbi:hypothetical protein D3C77_503280 [compost metagenome]
MPGALQQIGAVETGRRYLDANLAGVAEFTAPFRPLHTSFDTLQCLHAASIVSS